MLRRIQIRDFRTCRHVELDVGRPITALVGPNGAGKTTVLQAIDRVCRTIVGHRGLETHHRDHLPAETELEVALGTSVVRYHLSVASAASSEIKETLEVQTRAGKWIERVTRPGQTVILPEDNQNFNLDGFPRSCLPIVQEKFPDLDQVSKLITACGSVWYRGEEPDQAPACDESHSVSSGSSSNANTDTELLIDEPDRCREPETIPLDKFHFERNRRSPKFRWPLHWVRHRLCDMHLDSARAEQLLEVKSLLGPEGLGLIDEIIVDNTRANELGFQVWFRSADRESRFRKYFSELSSGIQRVIEIIVALVYERGSVLLWDHPENGIHPRLLLKVISLMQTYRDDRQLILATHSPTLVNSLHSDEVFLVALVDGETTVRHLTAAESEWAREYLNDTGTLYDFLESLQEA